MADGVAVWTGSFNERFTDVFTVQDEIAQKVVDALALRLGKILVQRGRYAEAGVELARAKVFSRGNSLTIAVAGYAAAWAGDLAGAQAALEELTLRSTQRYVPPSNLALIHAGLEQRDEAFRCLEKGFEERNIHLSYLLADPRWDSLRADPRFVGLLQRVGLR